MKQPLAQLGPIIFLAGIFISIVVGLAGSSDPGVLTLLAILGLIVGFVNINDRDINSFLLAVVALIISVNGLTLLSALDSEIYEILLGIMSSFVVFTIPAAVVLSLKAIWNAGSTTK